MRDSLTIWCNASFPPEAQERLVRGVGQNRLLLSEHKTFNLGVTDPDPLLEQADIAVGQPDPDQAIKLPRLRWIHLTSAGYTRYDRKDLREALVARGAALTNSSIVYADPCAQHVLA